MASELLDKGFKDPAAVITGSVLEEHLRKVGDKYQVPVLDSGGKPKKADRLNADLAMAGVYGTLELKQVTAWLDLRNNAAHAKYTEYDHRQVALLIQGGTDFLVRYPA